MTKAAQADSSMQASAGGAQAAAGRRASAAPGAPPEHRAHALLLRTPGSRSEWLCVRQDITVPPPVGMSAAPLLAPHSSGLCCTAFARPRRSNTAVSISLAAGVRGRTSGTSSGLLSQASHDAPLCLSAPAGWSGGWVTVRTGCNSVTKCRAIIPGLSLPFSGQPSAYFIPHRAAGPAEPRPAVEQLQQTIRNKPNRLVACVGASTVGVTATVRMAATEYKDPGGFASQHF
jgi:hypothetical protein